MTDVMKLLQSMQERGVSLWVHSGRLRYRAPPGAISPEDLAALRRLKEDVIDCLESDCATIPRNLRRAYSDFAPLTFQQQWLWDRIRQDERRAGVTAALRVEGQVDINILRASLDAVCARHEALRTKVITVDGIARQQISASPECSLETIRLLDGTNSWDDGALSNLCRAFFDEVSDLESREPLKLRVIPLTSAEAILAISMSPMIGDYPSLNIFTQELWYTYTEQLQGIATSLPPVSLQYGAYAEWQHRTSASWETKRGAYWRTRLEGADRIQFPTGWNSSRTGMPAVASVRVTVARETSRKLREVARREGTTVAMTVLALFVVWLGRLFSSRDVLVPFSSMGRQLPGLSAAIGLFAHPLFLRVALSRSDTFIDVVSRVKAEVVRAHDNDDFGRMVLQRPDLLRGTWFQWEPGAPVSDKPLATSGSSTSTDEGFVIRNESGHEVLRVRPYRLPVVSRPHSRFEADFAFRFFDRSEGIAGNGRYRADLVSSLALGAVVSEFEALAQAFADKPQDCIDRVFNGKNKERGIIAPSSGGSSSD